MLGVRHAHHSSPFFDSPRQRAHRGETGEGAKAKEEGEHPLRCLTEEQKDGDNDDDGDGE